MTVVLHITEKLERHGGTPRKLLYLAQHSDAAQQRHCFVTFVPGNLDAEMRAAGATVICAGSANVARVTRAVYDAARRERAEVISTHFTRALVCGVSAARVLGLPVVHHAHGPAAEQPRNDFVGHLGRLASRWSYPGTALVTANSRFTASTLQKVFGVPDRKLRVIPCPVSPRARSASGEVPGLPPRARDSLRLVQVGGLIPVRRHYMLMDALAAVMRAGVNAELIMVGDGPLKETLQARCRQLGVDSRVHWLGFRDDIGDVFSAADLYVSAIDSEGFGIAVVEAMLQGLPVVLADGGAHPELIEDGRHGELFDPNDAQDLANKIVALWANAPRRAALAQSAREYASRSYTPRQYAERYLSVLAEVHRS